MPKHKPKQKHKQKLILRGLILIVVLGLLVSPLLSIFAYL